MENEKALELMNGAYSAIGNQVVIPGADSQLIAAIKTALADMERLRKHDGDAMRLANKLLGERDTLKKALERYENPTQWLNDINNPLEPIKVAAALRSEILKYNFRLEHKPETISELDATIIYALRNVLSQAQEQETQK
jgi:hypothetical protein